MKSFIIHRRDGSIVAAAMAEQDNGPILTSVYSSDSSNSDGHMVTEVDLPSDIFDFADVESNRRAVEKLRAYRVEGRLVRAAEGDIDDDSAGD